MNDMSKLKDFMKFKFAVKADLERSETMLPKSRQLLWAIHSQLPNCKYSDLVEFTKDFAKSEQIPSPDSWVEAVLATYRSKEELEKIEEYESTPTIIEGPKARGQHLNAIERRAIADKIKEAAPASKAEAEKICNDLGVTYQSAVRYCKEAGWELKFRTLNETDFKQVVLEYYLSNERSFKFFCENCSSQTVSYPSAVAWAARNGLTIRKEIPEVLESSKMVLATIFGVAGFESLRPIEPKADPEVVEALNKEIDRLNEELNELQVQKEVADEFCQELQKEKFKLGERVSQLELELSGIKHKHAALEAFYKAYMAMEKAKETAWRFLG